MTDPAVRILSTAESDLAWAAQLLAEHAAKCRESACAECYSLSAHVTRCERQLALLTGPDEPEMEALF